MMLTGVYVPLITPFDAAGEVSYRALEDLAFCVLDEGATGLVALGTTGEPSALTDAEKHAVTQLAALVCRERGAQLIVGANTPEALQALRAIPEVTAALTLVPPFIRPGEAGVLAYFEHLAKSTPIPIVAYHVPVRTAQHLTAQALRRLAEIPAIAGLKYAPGHLGTQSVALFADPPPGCAVLCGDDALLSPMLALGAQGCIAASAHIETARYAELFKAWQGTDPTEARELGHRMARLSTALFEEPNPTVIKAVLHTQGRIPTPAVRLPLLSAHPDSTAAALRQLGWLTTEPVVFPPPSASPRAQRISATATEPG